MNQTDHWQSLFDKKYLRWFHLEGKEVTVEIEKVERGVELTMPGGNKELKSLVHFKGAGKPLVLNTTNAHEISKLHGEYYSQWNGKKITLYQGETRFAGKPTPCIRIKKVAK